jgi:hypothetical protein
LSLGEGTPNQKKSSRFSVFLTRSQLAPHLRVLVLAHGRVEPKLLRVLGGMVVFHQQAGGSGTVPEAELRAEVCPQGHEMVKDQVIAHYPGRQDREEDHRAERGARQLPQEGAAGAGQDPDTGERQKEHQ